MNTQQQEPELEQGSNQDLSGELHLPRINNTGTQRVTTPTQSEAAVPPLVQPTADSSQNVFYFQDDLSLEEDDADLLGSPLATPFQMSEEMPPLHSERGQFATTTPTPPPTPQSARKFPLLRVLILAAVIVIVILTGAMAFAQTSSPALPVHMANAPTRQATGQPTTPPRPQPTQVKKNAPTTTQGTGTTAGQNTGGSSTWIPQQLPTGWTNAGLTAGDALFGERTAIAFTDREMSLDFRSVGTRANHGGTFTAATFVLTNNARARFAQNDVRVTNNVLFDKVQQEKLIQSVVNAQPQLVKFTVVGQQQVAWVNVSFQLWQSKINANGARSDGFDVDPATNQPRIHRMMVLLLRIPQDEQGDNPAMGGTGWLVSNYALDLPSGTALDIAQPA